MQNLHFVVFLPSVSVESHVEQTNSVCIARDRLRNFPAHGLANQHAIGSLIRYLLQDCAVIGVQTFRGPRCIAYEGDAVLYAASWKMSIRLPSKVAKLPQDETWDT